MLPHVASAAASCACGRPGARGGGARGGGGSAAGARHGCRGGRAPRARALGVPALAMPLSTSSLVRKQHNHWGLRHTLPPPGMRLTPRAAQAAACGECAGAAAAQAARAPLAGRAGCRGPRSTAGRIYIALIRPIEAPRCWMAACASDPMWLERATDPRTLKLLRCNNFPNTTLFHIVNTPGAHQLNMNGLYPL